MKCVICGKRKGKRSCPARRALICPQCCGEKRGIEIKCPLDCQYYVEGQKNQQERIARERLKKEGMEVFIKRAELFRKNPEFYSRTGFLLATLFRENGRLTDSDVAQALELVRKTLDTEKKGLIYGHKSNDIVIDNIAAKILDLIVEFKDNPELLQNRVTVSHVLGVIEEFISEVKFHIEKKEDPQSFLIYLSRFYPPPEAVERTRESLIAIAPY